MNQMEAWNAIAPQWHKWREKPLSEIMSFVRDTESYLDIGCGSRRHLSKGKKIIGIDFSIEMLKLAKTFSEENKINAGFVLADACEMPLRDRSFGCVAAAAILHAIPKENHEKFMKELKRIMKKGGKCIITVWNIDQKRFKNSEKETEVPWKAGGETIMRYYYLFDKEELENLIKRSGFRADRVYLDAEESNIIAEISKI